MNLVFHRLKQSFLSTVYSLRSSEQGNEAKEHAKKILSSFAQSRVTAASSTDQEREWFGPLIFWKTSASSPKEASNLAQPAQRQARHLVWHSCGDTLNGKVKTSLLGEDLQSAVSFKMLKLTFLAIFLIKKEIWLKECAHIGLFLEPGKFVKFFHHRCFRLSHF